MSRDPNPYTPPNAPVRDIESAPLGPRPRVVNVALALLAIEFLVTLPGLLTIWRQFSRAEMSGLSFILLIALKAIFVWIWIAIARGRRWARIALLILTVLGLFNVMTAFSAMLNLPEGIKLTYDLVQVAYLIVPVVLNCVVVYLLFFPGRQWFANR
jgi:hypothetical protein